jgi:uncharacterized membrane protein
MCYNATISFIFGAIGLSTYVYIELFQPYLKSTGIQYVLLFYTIMEFLQSIQYSYVNQCANRMNNMLSEIAYVLVIVQPLMWNLFYYINSVECDKKIFTVGMVLSVIWIVINTLARILYKPENGMTKDHSLFASDISCTKSGRTHLFWEWPSANFKDISANYLTYLLIWFVPAFVSNRFRIASIVLFLFACIGALVSIYVDDRRIIPAVWCYISVPMVIVLIFYMILEEKRGELATRA